MKGAAAGTPLKTNRGGVITINTKQKCKKRWVLKNGLAHNGKVSTVVGNQRLVLGELASQAL
jgi:hypothetical protein